VVGLLNNTFGVTLNILHRHIFAQVILSAAMAVGLFVFVIVSVNAGRDIIGLLAGGRISWDIFFESILLLIPYATTWALPLGLLTAVMLVLGRMSSQNEITALKSAGISIYQLISPVIFVALLGILFSLFINFYYSPMTRTTYKIKLANLFRENPGQFIQPNTFVKEIPGKILYAGSKDGQKLKDFWVWELDEKNRVVRFIKAPEADFNYDDKEDAIILTFYNAVAEVRNSNTPEEFIDMDLFAPTSKTVSMRVPMDAFLGDKRIRRKLSMLTFGELFALRNDYIREESEGVEGATQNRIRVQMQFQENFSLAFSILTLSIFGIPLGIKANRSETYFNFMMAVILFLAYYLSVFSIKFLEEYPSLRPDLLIWIPNITFQGVGFWLLAKVNSR
jgi:lipopolysaccharide export system permease protein